MDDPVGEAISSSSSSSEESSSSSHSVKDTKKSPVHPAKSSTVAESFEEVVMAKHRKVTHAMVVTSAAGETFPQSSVLVRVFLGDPSYDKYSPKHFGSR